MRRLEKTLNMENDFSVTGRQAGWLVSCSNCSDKAPVHQLMPRMRVWKHPNTNMIYWYNLKIMNIHHSSQFSGIVENIWNTCDDLISDTPYLHYTECTWYLAEITTCYFLTGIFRIDSAININSLRLAKNDNIVLKIDVGEDLLMWLLWMWLWLFQARDWPWFSRLLWGWCFLSVLWLMTSLSNYVPDCRLLARWTQRGELNWLVVLQCSVVQAAPDRTGTQCVSNMMGTLAPLSSPPRLCLVTNQQGGRAGNIPFREKLILKKICINLVWVVSESFRLVLGENRTKEQLFGKFNVNFEILNYTWFGPLGVRWRID